MACETTRMAHEMQVLSDRFYGHVNYPRGGVGRIPQALAEGAQWAGSQGFAPPAWGLGSGLGSATPQAKTGVNGH